MPRLPFTTLRLHLHKSWRNAKHSSLANICLSSLLIARQEVHIWRLRRRKNRKRALTGRVGPVSIGSGVGCRAVAPQGGVTLAAVGRWDRQGTPKLAVRTGRWAQRGRSRDKPAAYWLHGESTGLIQHCIIHTDKHSFTQFLHWEYDDCWFSLPSSLMSLVSLLS